MKTRLNLISILLIAALAMAACAAPATQPPATQAPPTRAPASPTPNPNPEIVLNMVERLNAGDVEGSLAYFADDAKAYLIGFPPTGIEIYVGKNQIRSLWEDSANNHFQWEVNIAGTSGNEVNVDTKTWHDFTRQLGVAPLEYSDVYEVKDGKITTYGSWLTEASLARFMPAFAELMPPEPTPTPALESPGTAMTVTIAGGTCTTDSPLTLQAGEITVTLNVEDQDKALYALTLFNLDPGKEFVDLMASTVGMPPDWLDMLVFRQINPGKSDTFTFNLEKGPVYLVCWSQPPDLPIGNAGPFAVVP
jgi:hypothetical protein